MRMKRCGRRAISGGSGTLEFACSIIFLIFLTLGYVAIGMNLLMQLQLVQLARDAGHQYSLFQMYSNPNLNFTNITTRQVLGQIGGLVGLNTPPNNYPSLNAVGCGSPSSTCGNANVILSKITYVDTATCVAAGTAVDANGNPIGCTNWKYWVFIQQQVIGNASVRPSSLGTPNASLATGPGGTIPATGTEGYALTGDTSVQVSSSSSLSSIFQVTAILGNPDTPLPSGQYLCVSEAAAGGFNLAPFVTNAKLFEYNVF